MHIKKKKYIKHVESAFIDYGHKPQNYVPESCNQFSKRQQNYFVMKVNLWHLMPKWLLATHWTLEFGVCYLLKCFVQNQIIQFRLNMHTETAVENRTEQNRTEQNRIE